MAEMTAAEIISELKSEIAGFCTENLSDYMQVVRADLLDSAARLIEQQAAEITELRSIEAGAAYLNEQQAQEIEQAEAECKRLRVCGNCRHFSAGYTGDYCVKESCHGKRETLRQNTCRDWEMV